MNSDFQANVCFDYLLLSIILATYTYMYTGLLVRNSRNFFERLSLKEVSQLSRTRDVCILAPGQTGG